MCAGNVIGGIENFPDNIVFVVQLLSHANGLGTLSGK
jgi:hypothetical protein